MTSTAHVWKEYNAGAAPLSSNPMSILLSEKEITTHV